MKMEQVITEDKYLDHETHDVYLKDCSSCYSQLHSPWTDRPDYDANGEPNE